MKRRVLWTEIARSQAVAIIDYSAGNNPGAADRVADQIAAAAAGLGQFAIGRPGRVANTYEQGIGRLPHIIAYSLAGQPDGSEVVNILQIVHGARNWPEASWPE